MQMRDDRQPLPSEDSGDLAQEPAEGRTDDHLVATEEGVPYVPPTERVLNDARDDATELEREDAVQPPSAEAPRDGELQADVVDALRASDVVAGDRIRVAAEGSRVMLTGEVESVDVLDEILGIVGDVPGVDEVLDDVRVTRA